MTSITGMKIHIITYIIAYQIITMYSLNDIIGNATPITYWLVYMPVHMIPEYRLATQHNGQIG